jgi:hypothetical protein
VQQAEWSGIMRGVRAQRGFVAVAHGIVPPTRVVPCLASIRVERERITPRIE